MIHCNSNSTKTIYIAHVYTLRMYIHLLCDASRRGLGGVGECPSSLLLLGHLREVGVRQRLNNAFGRRGQKYSIPTVVLGGVADAKLLQLTIALGLQFLGMEGGVVRGCLRVTPNMTRSPCSS